MGQQSVDPYSPDPPYLYECTDCGDRTRAESHPDTCSDCDAPMRDLSVSRE